MDSLLLKKIADLYHLQDSILIHTKNLQETISHIKSESILLKLLPFIGVIVGGFLTYLGQYMLKHKDARLAEAKVISDAIYKIYANLNLLAFQLKEFAFIEVNRQYQYYNYMTQKDEAKKKALEEHYTYSKLKGEINTTIGHTASEITASFKAFFNLKKSAIPPETIIGLDAFNNHLLNLRDHEGFDIPSEDEFKRDGNSATHEMARKDIDILFSNYNCRTSSIHTLVEKLE